MEWLKDLGYSVPVTLFRVSSEDLKTSQVVV